MDDGAKAAAWFAGRLRELREKAGLTQQQLADKIDLTRDGVAQMETGRRSPSWQTVLAICSAFGVSCEEFRQAPAKAPKKGPGRPPKAKPADVAEGPPAKGKRKEK
jgi:DNA-binding XRE family transcriptional regulator